MKKAILIIALMWGTISPCFAGKDDLTEDSPSPASQLVAIKTRMATEEEQTRTHWSHKHRETIWTKRAIDILKTVDPSRRSGEIEAFKELIREMSFMWASSQLNVAEYSQKQAVIDLWGKTNSPEFNRANQNYVGWEFHDFPLGEGMEYYHHLKMLALLMEGEATSENLEGFDVPLRSFQGVLSEREVQYAGRDLCVRQLERTPPAKRLRVLKLAGHFMPHLSGRDIDIAGQWEATGAQYYPEPWDERVMNFLIPALSQVPDENFEVLETTITSLRNPSAVSVQVQLQDATDSQNESPDAVNSVDSLTTKLLWCVNAPQTVPLDPYWEPVLALTVALMPQDQWVISKIQSTLIEPGGYRSVARYLGETFLPQSLSQKCHAYVFTPAISVIQRVQMTALFGAFSASKRTLDLFRELSYLYVYNLSSPQVHMVLDILKEIPDFEARYQMLQQIKRISNNRDMITPSLTLLLGMVKVSQRRGAPESQTSSTSSTNGVVASTSSTNGGPTSERLNQN